MMKIIILAAIIAASIGAKAQATDTTAVMIRQLAMTNQKLAAMNTSLHKHSTMSVAGTSIIFIGGLVSFFEARKTTEQTPQITVVGSQPATSATEKGFSFGAAIITAGALLYLSSYIPLIRNRVHLDNRGLVVDLD